MDRLVLTTAMLLSILRLFAVVRLLLVFVTVSRRTLEGRATALVLVVVPVVTSVV